MKKLLSILCIAIASMSFAASATTVSKEPAKAASSTVSVKKPVKKLQLAKKVAGTKAAAASVPATGK